MKLRTIRALCFAVLGFFILHSCSLESTNYDPIIVDPDPIDPEDSVLKDGFFVVNEGQFPNAGSISFISNDFEIVENGLYHLVNNNGVDDDLGSGLQSMFFDTDRLAFIVSNGANYVTVVDRYTFQKIGRIDSGLEVPRYGVVIGDKAYITNQADFMTNEDDYIAVVDLNDPTSQEKIEIGDYVERIIRGQNGLLYIESAAFGEGNHVTVVDPSTNEVVDRIETADQLNSIALDNEYVYALTAKSLQKFNLNTGELDKEIALDYDESPAHLRYDDGVLYYTVGTSVYNYSTTFDEALASSPILNYTSPSEYGAMYGFEVGNHKIYIADGGDFQSNSFVEIFDLDGTSLGKFDVGVGPNGFYFNN